MSSQKTVYILSLNEIKKTDLQRVGGKAANLGELAHFRSVNIPEGFAITTDAFDVVMESIPRIHPLLDELSCLTDEEREEIIKVSEAIRTTIEKFEFPLTIWREFESHLNRFGIQFSYAVRSSATVEDQPAASFAGQHDTYLNIIGKNSILKHIRKCWASLFTERAVVYRMRNKIDHREVKAAVIIQKLIPSKIAGTLFTADPLSGNRKVSLIDASFGLGEALVSGIVNADSYKVSNHEIIDKKISSKKTAILPRADGGTQQVEIDKDQQQRQALSDEQILDLVKLGKAIEQHFGSPQDIEWCLHENKFYIVQSRPITTLFPVPEVKDENFHVFVSVGHQQMMTDPIKPLGISFFLATSFRPMYETAGRLFVDVSKELSDPAMKEQLFNGLGKSDPLIKDALISLEERGLFQTVKSQRNQHPDVAQSHAFNLQTEIEFNPNLVSDLIACNKKAIETLKTNIQTKSGPDLIDFILDDIKVLKGELARPGSMKAIMTGIKTSWWLNEKMQSWLGEKNVADVLSQSVAHNVTSEMGLALLEVADAIRPYPRVIEFLKNIHDENVLEHLQRIDGGQPAYSALKEFMDQYGMRCVGEIDITRERWAENPSTLLPVILSNVANFTAGEAERKFEQGKQEAKQMEHSLIERLRLLPDGEKKAAETKRMIDIMRNYLGYREYPKYFLVNYYYVYRQALLKEAGKLCQQRVLLCKEDMFYFTLQELREVLHTKRADHQLIKLRREAYHHYEKLQPPRVITSDGEIIRGKYASQNLPPNAIAGLAVSAGVIEGRARVITNLKDADLQAGDILVTTFTDPSWTPLFVSIKGLVTEVGGLVTHGAVIAREYGLPAITGVDHATRLIKDKQQIRVNGTEGYVELL